MWDLFVRLVYLYLYFQKNCIEQLSLWYKGENVYMIFDAFNIVYLKILFFYI